ncbi:LytR/AlgR family response regulator transcription factor [Dyadobacter aurulentus]|uniref:LytR/AlgR family response regulator transcription factor n=1 Tax=Dyadobacter sp. UC 10 TaxID=2605428 RepID=UPI0011F0F526|nr:LytTR family DNA-binding domain-containing protein [Dyadobacter sp. UC 10]KAA0992360.1 response regulator transcription factor [Dyadobacter sp. UC 10]
MIKVLIIDDEPRARHILHYYISTLAPEVSEIRMAGSVREAQQILDTYCPGIVFLDIEMPHQSGFDLLLRIRKPTFDIIFTTAHNQYAIQAIRFSALDYLLKPINPDELIMAIKRHLSKQDSVRQKTQLYENLVKNVKKKDGKGLRLAVPSNEGVFFFLVEEILRLEADRNYTLIHLKDRRPFIASKTLKHFEDMLEGFKFVRTHKSHLVNLDHVVRISNSNEFVIMSDGVQIKVSRRKKEEVLRMLHIR